MVTWPSITASTRPEVVQQRPEQLVGDRQLAAIAVERGLVGGEGRDHAHAAPVGLDDRVRDVLRGPPARPLGLPRLGDGARGGFVRHRPIVLVRRPDAVRHRRRRRGCHGTATRASTARTYDPRTPGQPGPGDQRRGAPRCRRPRPRRSQPEPSAATDPNLRTRSKARVGAVRLREHDLLVRGRVGAIGLWLTDDGRFGAATGQAVLSIAIIVSVGINALVSPVLGALSDRGGRRLPVPARVHGAVHRAQRGHRAQRAGRSASCCSSSRTSPTRPPSSTTTRRSSSSARRRRAAG